MSLYLILKGLHIVGAAVLFGTGIGIAFFMVMANRTRDAAIIAHTAGIVVIADLIFTATAMCLQPITGALLIHLSGYRFTDWWVTTSLILYVVTGAFWLPVLWMQYRMRELARNAVASGGPLPVEYRRFYRVWFAFGFPAFGAVLTIFWLMVTRPTY